MKIKMFALAASLAATMAGAAWAQNAPAGTVTGGTTDGSALSEPGSVPPARGGAATSGSTNPAGVIDGTNPNPNPTRAGGIRSPDAAVNNAPAGAVGR